MSAADPSSYSDDVLTREELIEQAEDRLLRHGWPRLQMFILVALTGAAGFLASYTLLQLGVNSMALRYPLAVAVAYGVFLLLLRVWLIVQRWGWEEVLDVGDALDVADVALDGTTQTAQALSRGGRSAFRHASTPSSGSGGGFDFPLDFDESALLVLVALLIVAVAALGTSLWLVWTAPGLLAEVLVDGLIMAGLYRRLKRHEEPTYWLYGAVRRTWVSAMVAAVLFAVAGGLLHQAVPEARSLGAAWKAVQAEKEAVKRP